jgi:hypothetical protein
MSQPAGRLNTVNLTGALVLAAIQLGYQGVAVSRDAGPVPASVSVITALEELLPIVR